MCQASASMITAVILAQMISKVTAKGFMSNQRTALRQGAAAFMNDVDSALGEVLGCGGHAEEDELASIERSLLPLWSALPKNGNGRIEKRMLRYLTYRHFMRQSSMIVRGFEQTPPANASDWGSAEILSQRVPGFVESVLQSRHKNEQGFDLRDAAYMVAAIEHLIFDSETALLLEVYERQAIIVETTLDAHGLQRILEEYVMRWIVGDNPEGLHMLRTDRLLAARVIPHWSATIGFVAGEVKAYDRARQLAPRAGRSSAGGAFSQRYSFDDAHRICGRIMKNFASYWRSECDAMHEALTRMDVHGTGRVPLSKFYSGAMGGEWRFSESETYLRDLGVLDETSSWRGKQVIIPNYIQAASNCMVSGPHYLVCCQNHCSGILDEIEAALGKPVASPGEIIAVVQNISVQATVDDEEDTTLSSSLRLQLEEIATANGGQVPMHGRLFAQWLHYTFPRDCPFPHKAGTVTLLTPGDYKEEYLAANSEIEAHVIGARHDDNHVAPNKEEVEWMSQWNAEEELIADYSTHIRTPLHTKALLGCAAVVVAGLTGIFHFSEKGGALPGRGGLPLHGKSHLV